MQYTVLALLFCMFFGPVSAQYPMRDTIKGKCIYYLPSEFSKELKPLVDTATWITRKASETQCQRLNVIDCGFYQGHKCQPYWEEETLLIGVRTNYPMPSFYGGGWVSRYYKYVLPIEYKLLFIPNPSNTTP